MGAKHVVPKDCMGNQLSVKFSAISQPSVCIYHTPAAISKKLPTSLRYDTAVKYKLYVG